MADIAVIGAGPAGVAASVQLARCGHAVTVYEKHQVGGAVRNARLVENYPGFPTGVTGQELARLFKEQITNFVTDIVAEEVAEVKFVESQYSVITPSGQALFDAVILCTGTRPVQAGFPGEDELAEDGLLSYELADLALDGIGNVGIVGGGEASMDYALALADKGKSVTLIHRSEPGAVKALYDSARSQADIQWVRSDVLAATEVDGRAVLRTDSGETAFDCVLVAVGREPSLPLMSGDGSDTGCLLIAGDARLGKLGQVAIAVGEGVRAAIDLDKELRGEG